MTLTTGWSVPAAGEGPDGHGEGGQPPTPPTASASNASNDLHGLTDSAGHRLRFTQTPRLHARHPAAQRWRAVPRRAALSGAPKTRNDRPIRGHPRRHRRSGIPQTVHPRGVQSDTCRPPIESGLTCRSARTTRPRPPGRGRTRSAGGKGVKRLLCAGYARSRRRHSAGCGPARC